LLGFHHFEIFIWFETISNTCIEPKIDAYFLFKGFENNYVNHNSYFKRAHGNYIVFITFGVINFILAFNDLILLKETKGNILKKFKVVDLNDI
jgi:hypothetical protein